jgi:hypothetical protein
MAAASKRMGDEPEGRAPAAAKAIRTSRAMSESFWH